MKPSSTSEISKARDLPLEDLGMRWWTATVAMILAVGVVVRVYQLGLKPLHHDEGVNGNFLLGLFRDGTYRYDPANYHGPTLYYFGLISSSINNLLFRVEGPSTMAIRAVPVFFGIGLILLVFRFRSRLGPIGTVTAAALIALSPGMVFFSRDFIHETLLVFFSLWFLVCCLDFWETRKIGDLLLASVAAALMVSTKETAPITMFSMATGAVGASLWQSESIRPSAAMFGGWSRVVRLGIAFVTMLLVSCFLFFSSFLGNFPQGIKDAFTTYTYWARTGMSQMAAPWYKYLLWLLQMEGAILILAVAGTATALIRRNNRFAIFAGIWASTLLASYSVLPYKTPWILVNMIVPMCLVAGYFVQEMWGAARKPATGKMIATTAAVFATGISLSQTVQLNFFHYDDPGYPYTFVQTYRNLLPLVDKVNEIATNAGTADNTTIAVVTPDYWPLPWYLRDYRRTGYFGNLTNTNSAIVIGSDHQEKALNILLEGRYRLVGTYPLRPGVDLLLYVSNEKTR